MYTAKQLAKQSGKSKRWIQNLCKLGIINAKKFGNAYLIEDAAANKYLSILEDITRLEADVRSEAEINGEIG